MDSPASRMSRLLSGFIVCLLGVTSIAVIDGRFTDFSEFGLFSVVCAISVLALILLVSLAAGRGREHGRWPTDSMISREVEEAMMSRIEKERDEASMQGLSSKWARMEMQHLESKHHEE
tara:strand:+ start:3546 stop:3902 length:357 start_codon:yes stop_codon:yes gene_type:complete